MRIIIQENYTHMSKWAANYVVKRINTFAPTASRPFLLGLPTGSSPLGMYEELIKLYKAGEVSFKHVITYNMDEYVGLKRSDHNSYFFFMHKYFFDYVDIPTKNVHILDGEISDMRALERECIRFEASMKEHGGIELFVGGIGADGHIAFNEPGSSLASRTRVKTLTENTRKVNARFFDNKVDAVPKYAVTVGVGTVMDAQEVMLLVSGPEKSRALYHCVEEGVNHMWTASCLQLHPRAVIVCDERACGELRSETVQYFTDIEQSERL